MERSCWLMVTFSLAGEPAFPHTVHGWWRVVPFPFVSGYVVDVNIFASFMWDLYDRLIAAVPGELEATDCLAGLRWFLVKSAGIGVAMRTLRENGTIRNAGHLTGMMLRDLAAWIKSSNQWDACAFYSYLKGLDGIELGLPFVKGNSRRKLQYRPRTVRSRRAVAASV